MSRRSAAAGWHFSPAKAPCGQASYTFRKSVDEYLPMRGIGRGLYSLSGAPTEAGANPGNVC
jgi:hypothetical protein